MKNRQAKRCKWMIVRKATIYETMVQGKPLTITTRCRRHAERDGQCWQHRRIVENSQ